MTGQSYSRPVDEALAEYRVDPASGLTEDEVVRRRRVHGANVLGKVKPLGALGIYLRQYANAVTALLSAAVIVAAVFGDVLEAVAIGVVILVNTGIGFATELKARRSIEGLRKLVQVPARVLRGGALGIVEAGELVPGDIVAVEAGDLVPADMRLVDRSALEVDESLLTGESLPVEKTLEPLPEETLLAERTNMLYRATAVTRGTARGVVIATGKDTEVGQIAEMVAAAEETRTPLERRLNRFSIQLMWVTFGLALVVGATGVLTGHDVHTMVQTAIALAVAAIPEGLPVVAVLTLARGVWRMAARNALVQQLSAVEALGATTVILTDKTGTLTENRMTVTDLMIDGDRVKVKGATAAGQAPLVSDVLRVAVLCTNASLARGESDKHVGDAMEVAILEAAEAVGLRKADLEQEAPRCREEAFDPSRRLMATFNCPDGEVLICVKGGPEAVLDASTSMLTADGTVRPLTADDRAAWLAANEALAAEGLRLLAVARRRTGDSDGPPYRDLEFLGLMAFSDPPRPEIRDAVEACYDAGLRVVMVTGDQLATGRSVAAAVGLDVSGDNAVVPGARMRELLDDREALKPVLKEAVVFSRVAPEEKFALVDAYQDMGEVVAMTGDGVNDAPALKKADVGVAMGHRGTQVAREAADMILRDDSFTTIAAAIREGRVIFGNIRQSVLYLLACNFAEVLIVSAAVVGGLPLPLTALQILFLNLLTDVFPALALGMGEGPGDVMRRPPREPGEDIIARRHWWEIVLQGSLMTVGVLGAFTAALFWLDLSTAEAVTVTFLTLATAQLWNVFAVRSARGTVFTSEVARNPFVWGAFALCATLIALALYIPPLAAVMALHPPEAGEWALIAGFGIMPLVMRELLRAAGVGKRRAERIRQQSQA